VLQVRKFSQSWQVRVSTAFKRLLIIVATPWDISLHVIYIIYMICVYMYACICVYACMYMCMYIHVHIYMCVVCIYAYICTMVPWYHGNSRAVEGYGILVYIATCTKIYQFICFFDGEYGVVLI